MKRAKNIFYIIFGAFVASVSLNVFLAPYGFVPGGLSGLAMVTNKVSNGILPIGVTILIFNIPLFVLGAIILGKRFIFKSILGTLVYSIMVDLTVFIVPYINKLLKWDVFLQNTTSGNVVLIDRLLYAIIGGLFLGCGFGLIFKGGATTGGTDILARLMQRNLSWLSLGQLVLAFDVLCLVIVALAYKSLIAAFYSAVVVFVSSKVIDYVEAGLNYAKQVYIITYASEEEIQNMAHELMEQLDRAVTRINGKGMYSNKEVVILLCVLQNRQLPILLKTVKMLDPAAFLIINDVREVSGSWNETPKQRKKLKTKK